MFFGNRQVRTRMLGGVGAGGENPPATRFVFFIRIVLILLLDPSQAYWEQLRFLFPCDVKLIPAILLSLIIPGIHFSENE